MSNHPRIANKLIMVDFDGTIVPWGPLMADKEPFPGVAAAMQQLKEWGFRLGIFSSRMSPTWTASAKTTVTAQEEYIRTLLTRYGVPFDFITAEKVPAIAYFDDMAHHVPDGQLGKLLLRFGEANSE